MKNRITKIISSLLVLSFLISMLSVFSTFTFADDTENTALSVLVNRGYEDGWDWNNGFSSTAKGNATLGYSDVFVDYEADSIGNYNYFVRYKVNSAAACFGKITMDSSITESTAHTYFADIFEFSVKCDDYAPFGELLTVKTGVALQTATVLRVNENHELVLFPNKINASNKPSTTDNYFQCEEELNLGEFKNEWVNIGIVFDWYETHKVKDSIIKVKVYYGYGLNKGYQECVELDVKCVVAKTGEEQISDSGLTEAKFGFPALATRNEYVLEETQDMSFCLDNLKAYTGVPDIIELDDDDYGKNVNTMAAKTIDIKTGAGQLDKATLLKDSLSMKVGVNHALIRDERFALVNNKNQKAYSGVYGAPVKKGDNVLVPLQLLLDYIGLPSYIHPDGQSFDITTGTSATYLAVGRSTASVDGKTIELSEPLGYVTNSEGEKFLAITVSDISLLFPGWLAIYDDMGIIIVYQDTTPDNLEDNAPIVTRDADLDTMLTLMKKFVFDIKGNATDPSASLAIGEGIYGDAKEASKNFQHPYVIANADTFALLKTKYALTEGAQGYDATFKAYVDKVLLDADKFYTDNANVTAGVYSGIKASSTPKNPYTDTNDGYNAKSGRLDEIVKYTEMLPTLALAYQITGNQNYAKFAYDWMSALAAWKHWGPGYFENCAEATSSYAIAYDWFYNGFKSLSLDTDELAKAIFDLGVMSGFNSSFGIDCQYPSSNLVGYDKYTTKTTGTNVIGTSGMIIGALSILDYLSDEERAESLVYAEKLIGSNLITVADKGLDIYAPDGSYIESPTRWEKATSAMFRMIMAITSVAGDDYGLIDAWGIDKTCYYAAHIESSDGDIWNYHDGGLDKDEIASLNTDMFNFAATIFADANLLAVRKAQLANGKGATIYDLIYYPFDKEIAKPELSLDYHMDGIDAFVSRDSWEPGSMYTGLMGGANNCEGGQIDSGNFIYYNNGIMWAVDLGEEDVNIASYWKYGAEERYKYFRASAEGQNVVLINDNDGIAFGQTLTGSGNITSTFTNEHGSYAVLDNSSAYGTYVDYARRGLLITADRSVVVVHDEISFNKAQGAAWVMNTFAAISISDDGRTAYLSAMGDDGESYYVRVSIVAPRLDFKFRKETDLAASPSSLLSNTSDLSGKASGYSKQGINRLIIESRNIVFNISVVFEVVANQDDTTPVDYRYTEIRDWLPLAKGLGVTSEEVVVSRGDATVDDIIEGTNSAKSILKRNTAFLEKIKTLYENLTLVEYALKSFDPTNFDSELSSAYAEYMDAKEEYDDYIKGINKILTTADAMIEKVAGMQNPVETEE